MRMPLVIEEDVGTQDRQNTPLVHSAEEKSLVNRNVPLAQRRHDPLMGGCGTCGHDRHFHITAVFRIIFYPLILQLMEFRKLGKKIGKRPRRMRDLRLFRFRRIKLLNAFFLVDLLRTGIGDHSVEVERDAEPRIVRIVLRGAGENLPGGLALFHRLPDIARIGGKEQ